MAPESLMLEAHVYNALGTLKVVMFPLGSRTKPPTEEPPATAPETLTLWGDVSDALGASKTTKVCATKGPAHATNRIALASTAATSRSLFIIFVAPLFSWRNLDRREFAADRLLAELRGQLGGVLRICTTADLTPRGPGVNQRSLIQPERARIRSKDPVRLAGSARLADQSLSRGAGDGEGRSSRSIECPRDLGQAARSSFPGAGPRHTQSQV